MSRIYEALQQAQRERRGLEEPAVISPQVPVPSYLPSDFHGLNMEKRMIRLYQNIALLFPNFVGKIIQFMGSREGEGTSTIVRELGRVSANNFRSKVLLLDADRSNPSQHLAFHIRPEFGWEDALREEKPIDQATYQIDDSNLFLSPVSPRYELSSSILDSPRMNSFLIELRQRFDLILIDSSPALMNPESIAFSRRADGVVLILEAERTRWSLAERVKEQTIKNGGKILGIVFNKRQYHIPKFIYRWL